MQSAELFVDNEDTATASESLMLNNLTKSGYFGATEKAGVENATQSKLQGWKMQE